MKKLLLAAALFAAIGAQAQTFTLTWGADKKTAAPGESIHFTGFKPFEMNNCDIFVTSSEATTIDATLAANGKEGFQICAGGSCETVGGMTNPDYKITKKNLTLKANNPYDLQIEVFSPTEPEYLIGTLTINVSGKPETSQEYIIVVNDNTGGVSMIAKDADLLFENGMLVYHLDGAATITLYDLQGRAVLSVDAEGNGSVSTSNLPAGIYAYGVEGCVKKNGKIYVK